MSSLASPVAASTSPKIGTSISTPLVVLSPWRTHGDWANPTTATPVTGPPVTGPPVAGPSATGPPATGGAV